MRRVEAKDPIEPLGVRRYTIPSGRRYENSRQALHIAIVGIRGAEVTQELQTSGGIELLRHSAKSRVNVQSITLHG